MTRTLRVVTYNLHKGLSQFNRRLTLHTARERLHGLGADLVFLQEVQGEHRQHAVRYAGWPAQPQHEFLTPHDWQAAYGRNAVYEHGHHGNAILSRYPIARWINQDISAHRFESRGLLHCEVEIPGWGHTLHGVCLHLGLFSRGRRRQLEWLCEYLEAEVPRDSPLIVAGDFNDWRRDAHHVLAERLGLVEVFEQAHGRAARSFPCGLPLLRLDRIYVRALRIQVADVHHGRYWSGISDHAALSALLSPQV